jgi:hypothetical protein
MGFGLVDDGHVAVILEFLQVNTYQPPQLLLGILRLHDRIPEPFEYVPRLVFVELDQDVVLVFEIEIDGSIRHAGFLGDLGDRRLVEPLVGKYPDRGLKDLVVLGPILLLSGNGVPPDADSL